MLQKHERIEVEGSRVRPGVRKPYAKPEIIHELELETRAGTPLSPPDQFDPWNRGPES